MAPNWKQSKCLSVWISETLLINLKEYITNTQTNMNEFQKYAEQKKPDTKEYIWNSFKGNQLM